MESILDHAFNALGINSSEECVDRPVLMTEAVTNLPYSRSSKSMSLSLWGDNVLIGASDDGVDV